MDRLGVTSNYSPAAFAFRMKLDPAVVEVLNVDASKTKVASHGGSGFSTTAKISAVEQDGTEKHYFMKVGQGSDKALMFEGEHASLNAIHDAVPTLCPASLAFGPMKDAPNSYFLVTDFLDMSSRSLGSSTKSRTSLAAKLAKLHTTPAPVPAGRSTPAFGFPHTTCCGDTPQRNDYEDSWAKFYADNRLRAILERSERTNGRDRELRELVEQTVEAVVPRLLDNGHLNGGKGVVPVTVHGDLWSGNRGEARIAGVGEVEEVVFDPSACYAHSEFELGIMQMFGGFGGSFLKEYHKICPKTEPVEEYEDRVSLYEL